MKKNGISVLLLICFSVLLLNVNAQDKYFLKFVDKEGTPYSITNPQEFLSERSIARRDRQNIELTEVDLPVSTVYLGQVLATGVQINYSLKWFNGVVVTITDELQLTSLSSLPFVLEVKQIFVSSAKSTSLPEDEVEQTFQKKAASTDYYNYGNSETQVKMMNGHLLHNKGFRGEGILIAVVDAGFKQANALPAFDSLWIENRVLQTRDFVNPTSNIYEEHSHGMLVLSSIAGNISGQLIGTAPKASFVLIRSEDTSSEQVIEEYNWAAAAEYADSLGVDIINSSLGYYLFDVEGQNYTHNDLDGETTPSAQAANAAFSRGMLVIASAGNEGNNTWQRIITPSDAFGSIAVGAVDASGNYASFSSIGPSADGRVKPDVSAMGKATVVQNLSGSIGTVNGTSLSAPLISGMAACLWQQYPNLTANEIRQLIIQSASLYNNPNNMLGYGIPNFGAYASGIIDTSGTKETVRIFPNPSDTTISFVIPQMIANNELTIRILTNQGTLVYSSIWTANGEIVTFPLPSHLTNGLYLISITANDTTIVGKFIRSSI
jgi:subtilisin family serine protease